MAERKIGRPVGSKSGREPPGGYPSIPPGLGAFLAGFIEGEGSFSIRKQPRNTNHACNMGLCARDDDAELIHHLARRTRVGRVTRTAAHGTSRPQVTWTVAAKADCLRLVEILDRYPLRGRKSRDYAIWSAAVRWWVTDDPTTTIRFRDWEPMIYLKARLQEAKRFSRAEARRTITDEVTGLESDWPDYLAGLVTAEGTLGIHRHGPGLAPKLAISLRSDDRPLLRDLQRRTRVGSICEGSQRSPSRAPAITWFVRDRRELYAMVEVLDAHSPRGKKLEEYAVWREAVIEYGNSSPARRRARMAELRERLAAVRTYRSRPHTPDHVPSASA